MNAASMILSPIVMVLAEKAFSTLQEDKYLTETKRHNRAIAAIEKKKNKWNQTHALQQREYERRILSMDRARQSQNAGAEMMYKLLEKIKEDEVEEKQQIEKRSELSDQTETEDKKHKKNNPYYQTTEVVVSAGAVFAVYKIYKKITE